MFVCYYGHTTKAHNNLEKDFENYLKSIDRTTVPDEEINEFKKKILDEYTELCQKHSRCKPWPKHFEKGYENPEDMHLRHCNVTFKLLKAY